MKDILLVNQDLAESIQPKNLSFNLLIVPELIDLSKLAFMSLMATYVVLASVSAKSHNLLY